MCSSLRHWLDHASPGNRWHVLSYIKSQCWAPFECNHVWFTLSCDNAHRYKEVTHNLIKSSLCLIRFLTWILSTLWEHGCLVTWKKPDTLRWHQMGVMSSQLMGNSIVCYCTYCLHQMLYLWWCHDKGTFCAVACMRLCCALFLGITSMAYCNTSVTPMR